MDTLNTLSSQDIEIQILKNKLQSLELQMQFLNKNWVQWTKDTKLTGQRLMIALEEMLKKDNACSTL